MIKEGVFRNVHVSPKGVAAWVVHIDGKSVATRGRIENGAYVPHPKYAELVDRYRPQRRTFKRDNVLVIKSAPINYQKLEGIFQLEVFGKVRRFFRSSRNTGYFVYKAEKILGRLNEDGSLVVTKCESGAIEVGTVFALEKIPTPS